MQIWSARACIGKDDDLGSASIALAGGVSIIDGNLTFTPGENHLDIQMPLFGSFAGFDLGSGVQPLIQLTGEPLRCRKRRRVTLSLKSRIWITSTPW